jgi:hypothetical protein
MITAIVCLGLNANVKYLPTAGFVSGTPPAPVANPGGFFFGA